MRTLASSLILLLLPLLSNAQVSRWETTFDGKTLRKGAIYASAVAPNGDLYIAGPDHLGGFDHTGIFHWNGTEWRSIGEIAATTEAISAILVDADGSVIVGGVFKGISGTKALNVARWNGSAWSPLGAGLNEGVDGLARGRDGIYAVGRFTTSGTTTCNYIARWSQDSGWTAVGAGADEPISAIIARDSTLFISGSFDLVDGKPMRYVARRDGSLWSAMTGGSLPVTEEPEQMVLGDDGLFVLFSEKVAHWTGAGWRRADSGSTGPRGRIASIGIGDEGLYCGTYVLASPTFNQHARGYVELWDGSTWKTIIDETTDGFDALVHRFEPAGTSMYMFGNFDYAGTTFSPSVVRWDGTRFHALGGVSVGGGLIETRALATTPGWVYVGGLFHIGDGAKISNLARWNGAYWMDLDGGPNNLVTDMEADGQKLYVAGTFSRVGSLDAWYLARWENERWDTLPSVVRFADGIEDVAASGEKVYIGTRYWRTSGGGYGYRIYRLVGNEWVRIADSLDRPVEDMIAEGDSLIVCGGFTKINGDTMPGVARWNASSGWEAIGGGVAVSHSQSIRATTLLRHEGNLYAAGNFRSAGGIDVHNVAKWDGTTWSPVGAVGGESDVVFDLTVHQGKLVAVGALTRVNVGEASGLAWWDGTRWLEIGDGAYLAKKRPLVQAVTSSMEHLFISGRFDSVATRKASRFASWYGTLGAGSVGSPAEHASISLDAPTPNPATNDVEIAFTLSSPGTVALRVVDVLGRPVTSIADGHVAAGSHTVHLDASTLATGTYTIVLQAAGATRTTRLVVRR